MKEMMNEEKFYKKWNRTKNFHVKKATLDQEILFLWKYQEFVKKYKNIDEMMKS